MFAILSIIIQHGSVLLLLADILTQYLAEWDIFNPNKETSVTETSPDDGETAVLLAMIETLAIFMLAAYVRLLCNYVTKKMKD